MNNNLNTDKNNESSGINKEVDEIENKISDSELNIKTDNLDKEEAILLLNQLIIWEEHFTEEEKADLLQSVARCLESVSPDVVSASTILMFFQLGEHDLAHEIWTEIGERFPEDEYTRLLLADWEGVVQEEGMR